jgi:broad specificity phosphatase PhoE
VSTKPTQVVLVRHAETEWSLSGQHTGRIDIPLTERGRDVARRLAPALREWHFDTVLTSPLERAHETCRLAGLAGHEQVREELLEWDYGDYEGRTTPEIRAERPDWYLWRDGCPNGEQAPQVGERVDRVIAELVERGGTVAVFSHGHVLRVLAARWVQLPPEAGALFALSTGSICVLGYERETRVLTRWNDTHAVAEV